MSAATSASKSAPSNGAKTAQIDPDKLNAFMGRMLNDLGAVANGSLVILGDRLGIYSALRNHGPCTSEQLASATGLHERHLREWLSAQAASEYITYDAASETFSLTPEQATVLADPDSPAAMVGGFYTLASTYHDESKIAESFRTGKGVPWGDHHACLFCGTERFFRPGYEANLVSSWLPSLNGVVEKLNKGARVADVGCGHGASTFIMAKAFPNSEFIGYDLHPASIDESNKHAAQHGLKNLKFEIASAQDFGGNGFDLVAIFDALHDMGDPVGASKHVRKSLAPDGTFMIVEPRAGDTLAENLNPVGRVYYAASTMICTPGALSQPGGMSLGAQAGIKRLTEVLNSGGFSKVRRATDTPFNVVLEARA
ncbi:MAG: class I SAM-dependent methyltransferase [Roseimicrobium sp.]